MPRLDGLAQYSQNAVTSATPAQLLTMLYDRLLLDLQRAETAQQAEDWQSAHSQLLHAQAIIAELRATLRTDLWDGAESLAAIYDYVANALVSGNVNRDVRRTREAIDLLEPLRQAWHEAAGMLPATQGADRVG